MTINISLIDPDNASNPTSLEGALATNNDAIEAALKKALSKHGDDGDNFMHVDLDMNNYRILNIKSGTAGSDIVLRRDLSFVLAGEFQKDVTSEDLQYREPGATAWTTLYTKAELTGPAGTDGAGVGDLLAANNLSDVSSASTSRTNLGLAIGTDVLAYDANLVGFNPANKADLTDSRFTTFDTASFSATSTATQWGKLLTASSGSSTTLSFTTATAGQVLTLYVPAASGDVTIAPLTGSQTVFVAGEVTARSPIISAGGLVTIIAVGTDTFLVSGSGIQA